MAKFSRVTRNKTKKKPEQPHPTLERLKEIAAQAGLEVREERLTREVGYSVRGGACRVDGRDVVLLDKNTDPQAQPLYARLWGAGFLPSNHQGVKLRGSGDPVLYLNDPTGASMADKRKFLDRLAEMNLVLEDRPDGTSWRSTT